jgi:hypothetical protein
MVTITVLVLLFGLFWLFQLPDIKCSLIDEAADESPLVSIVYHISLSILDPLVDVEGVLVGDVQKV